MAIIEDGTGAGKQAKVDGINRLYVYSVTQTEEAHNTLEARAYHVTTGTINLTGASISGLLYLKNTHTSENITVESFSFYLGNTDGTATDNIIVKVVGSPTTGTLIDSGAAVTPRNKVIGSTTTMTATALKGAYGSTVTNGTTIMDTLFPSVGKKTVDCYMVIPPQETIAITVTPKGSNSDMDVQLSMVLFQGPTRL